MTTTSQDLNMPVEKVDVSDKRKGRPPPPRGPRNK